MLHSNEDWQLRHAAVRPCRLLSDRKWSLIPVADFLLSVPVRTFRRARLLNILSEFIEENVPHAGQEDIFSFEHGVFTKEPPVLYFTCIITHITVLTFRRHMKGRSGGAGVQTWAPPTVTLQQTTFISERLKYVYHKPCFFQSLFSFDSTKNIISQCIQYMHH